MQLSDELTLKGTYRFTKAKLEKPEHYALADRIARARDRGDDISGLVRLLHSICRTEVLVIDNLIPTTGRAAIANNLTAVSPSPASLLVNYVALGSNATTPANADTTLGTETYRNAIASRTNSSNIAYLTGFFSATETSGTYREVGLFINGTGSADSGTLFSHAAVNITKSTSETLTVDWTVTIS